MTPTIPTNLLQSIANTLADYQAGEIPPITAEHVARWLDQFDATDHPTILAETDHFLRLRYVNGAAMQATVQALMAEVLDGLSPDKLDRVQLIECFRDGKGSSRRELTQTEPKCHI